MLLFCVLEDVAPVESRQLAAVGTCSVQYFGGPNTTPDRKGHGKVGVTLLVSLTPRLDALDSSQREFRTARAASTPQVRGKDRICIEAVDLSCTR